MRVFLADIVITIMKGNKKNRKWRSWGSSLIFSHDVWKGRFLGNFIKLITKRIFTMKTKIYTDKNKEIQRIIEKNSQVNSR